jgi:hypothetical protein
MTETKILLLPPILPAHILSVLWPDTQVRKGPSPAPPHPLALPTATLPGARPPAVLRLQCGTRSGLCRSAPRWHATSTRRGRAGRRNGRGRSTRSAGQGFILPGEEVGSLKSRSERNSHPFCRTKTHVTMVFRKDEPDGIAPNGYSGKGPQGHHGIPPAKGAVPCGRVRSVRRLPD